MKHKTVRQNVFETNSSSTHSVTLYTRSNLSPTFKPYSATGKLDIGVAGSCYTTETWFCKLSLLAQYLLITGRKDELGRIEKLISDFSGMEMTFNVESIETYCNRLEDNKAKYSTTMEDSLSDHFYIFLKDQYDNKPLSDFTDVVEEILASDEMIVGFICGSGWFEVNEYYDG